jgi:hypothetical protein
MFTTTTTADRERKRAWLVDLQIRSELKKLIIGNSSLFTGFSL